MRRSNQALNRTAAGKAFRIFRSCCAPLSVTLLFAMKLMPALIIIAFLALSGWMLVALFRRLRRDRGSFGSWVVAGLLVGIGLAFGIWSGFYCEYHVGTHYRFSSFPIPIVFFHLEDGQWVDFPVPTVQAWASAFADMITLTALATVPLWFFVANKPMHRTPR
jgi:hypothetical protein